MGNATLTAYPEGIDVSDHQGTVKWEDQAAGGVQFAYIKATEGTTYVDPYFPTDVVGCEQNGIRWGAYHFWRPDLDAAAQINNFARAYGKWVQGELPPALDVEADPGQYPDYTAAQFIAHVYTCLNVMEKLCGKRPVLYTYPAFWRERMGNTQAFKDYPLWIAGYPSIPNPMIGGWANYAIHQYTDNGSVKGLHVDLNHFNGSYDDLKAFCGITPKPPVPPSYTPPGAKFSIGGGFRDLYMAEPKALQYFGLPITGEMQEDGLTVQYFERARFEWHQELPGKPVLLGLVGVEAAKARGVSV